MMNEVNAEAIKGLRGKYKISQQTLATLLGIGEASIVRYENGQEPSRANANLLRAADNPVFIQECLSISGALLPAEVRSKVEGVVYELVSLDEGGEGVSAAGVGAGVGSRSRGAKPDMNAEYEITLQQEILNEKAAGVVAKAARLRAQARSTGDEKAEVAYSALFKQLARLKGTVTDKSSRDLMRLSELNGMFDEADCILDLLDGEA